MASLMERKLTMFNKQGKIDAKEYRYIQKHRHMAFDAVRAGIKKERRIASLLFAYPAAGGESGYFLSNYRVDITVWKTLWRM